ncbi:hypothetical protein J2X43_000025 [Rhizobium sp. BE258]|nr:hypothetical protein [Rhizobium sp. BE258]
MGPEIEYIAEVAHPELGPLSWHLWEYPVGVENFQNEEMNGHELVDNFNISLEAEPDTEDQVEAVADEMKEWFYAHYEDPAQSLPHSSADGGYQWINGGPYEPTEVLEEEFGSRYPFSLIEQVGKIITDETGLFDWSPVRDDDFFEDAADPSAASPAEDSGADGLVKQVSDFTLLIAPLLEIEETAPDRPSVAGIGHNGPPNPIEELGLEQGFFRALDARSRNLADLARRVDAILQNLPAETAVPVPAVTAGPDGSSDLQELASAIRENTEAIRLQSTALQSTIKGFGAVAIGGYVLDKMFDGVLGKVGELLFEKGAVMAPPLAAAAADYLHIVAVKLDGVLDAAMHFIHALPAIF